MQDSRIDIYIYISGGYTGTRLLLCEGHLYIKIKTANKDGLTFHSVHCRKKREESL